MLKNPVTLNAFSFWVMTLNSNFFHATGKAKGMMPSNTKTRANAEKKLTHKTNISNKKGLSTLNPLNFFIPKAHNLSTKPQDYNQLFTLLPSAFWIPWLKNPKNALLGSRTNISCLELKLPS